MAVRSWNQPFVVVGLSLSMLIFQFIKLSAFSWGRAVSAAGGASVSAISAVTPSCEYGSTWRDQTVMSGLSEPLRSSGPVA